MNAAPCPAALAGTFGAMVAEADRLAACITKEIQPGLFVSAVPGMAELPVPDVIAFLWRQVEGRFQPSSDATFAPSGAHCRPGGAPGGDARKSPDPMAKPGRGAPPAGGVCSLFPPPAGTIIPFPKGR